MPIQSTASSARFIASTLLLCLLTLLYAHCTQAAVNGAQGSPSSSIADKKPSLCAGFKRLALQTSPGLCAGLVASNLGFARGVAVAGGDVWIADMGGWKKNHGRLLRIKNEGQGTVEEMLSGLDRPNALTLLPNGLMLVGYGGNVASFDPRNATPGKLQLNTIVKGLPSGGRHPLPALAPAADGTLYINIGSATDHCEDEGGKHPDPNAVCPETQESPPRGSIIAARWDRSPAQGMPAGEAKIVARGLRNSMALTLDESSHLWAAVNARDFINLADPSLSDENLPPDTLVQVKEGSDYGWPQCYGIQLPSPEYPNFSCAKKAAPTALLPAHAAPLGMIYIDPTHPLGGLKQGLLIAYHGYRKAGHRIVWQQMRDISLQGGPRDILWQWESAVRSGTHTGNQAGFTEDGKPTQQGAPVALVQLANGNVLMTDDHSGSLIILAVDIESKRH